MGALLKPKLLYIDINIKVHKIYVDTIIHMISTFWRTSYSSIRLSITKWWYQPNPCYDEKNFLCPKTYYFDHWQLQVQIVLHLCIILCYSYFWPIIFEFTSLNPIMNYNQISNFNVFRFIFKCQKWFLIFNHTWFLLRILWCSQSDNHPENNLAKFGYIIDMKIRKQIESFYILGYLLQVIIKFDNSKI
jgi:hypothetical protein